MPSRARLDWQGERLAERVRGAARAGVNETVDAARDDAKATHEPMWENTPTKWSKEGGQLEEEIVSEHAGQESLQAYGPDPVGRFGFARKRGFYGYFHEIGTVHEFAKPVLRPTADRIFPTLAERIRRRLAR